MTKLLNPPQPPASHVPHDVPHPVVVLLVDDQPVLGRAVRELLAPERDIQFHFCHDPHKAVALAEQLAPTVLLLDLAMPDLHGLSLLRQLHASSLPAETSIIVLSVKEEPLTKAQAFALGANDYLVKLPDRTELIARIRHHSRGCIAQRQRNEAYQKLAESQQRLATEISHAAAHIHSLLPAPVTDGPVRIDWRFIPSMQLGGDAFGYQWLDDQHLAMYLLDVSGHGIGASLLAVSALNALLNRTLPNTNFHDPSSVMHGLNKAFNMNRQGGRFFTIWYGVFATHHRKLTFSGGGHVPPLLFTGPNQTSAKLQEIDNQGPPIGVFDDSTFDSSTVHLPPFARLVLYSDGAVEIGEPGGDRQDQNAFTQFIAQTGPSDTLLDQTLHRCRHTSKGDLLQDDCSLMLVEFR
jgi:phosphoserine phosphatase RsbU/P